MEFHNLGADVNFPYLATDWGTLLFWAVLENHKEGVKWLIERGAQLGEQSEGTLLNNAVFLRNPEMILLFLEMSADPNLLGSTDSVGQTDKLFFGQRYKPRTNCFFMDVLCG